MSKGHIKKICIDCVRLLVETIDQEYERPLLKRIGLLCLPDVTNTIFRVLDVKISGECCKCHQVKCPVIPYPETKPDLRAV